MQRVVAARTGFSGSTDEIQCPRAPRALRELGYRGSVGLECEPLESEFVAAEGLAQADRW